jgi:hypothetical protein
VKDQVLSRSNCEDKITPERADDLARAPALVAMANLLRRTVGNFRYAST